MILRFHATPLTLMKLWRLDRSQFEQFTSDSFWRDVLNRSTSASVEVAIRYILLKDMAFAIKRLLTLIVLDDSSLSLVLFAARHGQRPTSEKVIRWQMTLLPSILKQGKKPFSFAFQIVIFSQRTM